MFFGSGFFHKIMPSKKKKAHELTDKEAMAKIFHPKILKRLKQEARKGGKK